MTINNINDLATYLDTSIDNLKDVVHKYNDYSTIITWDTASVTLRTVVPEAEAELTKSLRFPFDDEDYDDAIVGLQCWADSEYCEAIYRGDE